MSEPTHYQRATISSQRELLAALAALAEKHPELPAPYISAHGGIPQAALIFSSHSALEAWREALAVDHQDVQATASDEGQLCLSFDAEAGDAMLRLSATAPCVSQAQVVRS